MLLHYVNSVTCIVRFGLGVNGGVVVDDASSIHIMSGRSLADR